MNSTATGEGRIRMVFFDFSITCFIRSHQDHRTPDHQSQSKEKSPLQFPASLSILPKFHELPRTLSIGFGWGRLYAFELILILVSFHYFSPVNGESGTFVQQYSSQYPDCIVGQY